QDVMLEVVEAGAALYDRNPTALADQLRRVWSDLAVRKTLQDKADNFIARYICAYGDQAAERIAESLRGCVRV
ncbi:hypothetical protein D4S03_04990, partial [bacterium]